jgi:flagellar protein FlaG
MSTEISGTMFSSAMAPHPAFHPAVEPRRPTSVAPQPSSNEPVVLDPVFDSKEIKHAVAEMNELAKASNHRLSFTMDYETNDVIVKVIDAATDKVIKELPPAELQKLHKSLKEAVGVLFDKMI